jgi:hypothetical protein
MSTKSLIEIFLQFPSQVKLYHWQTKKFSRHKASDSLFSCIQELIDQFVETYQGKYTRIFLENDTSIPIYNLNDRDIVTYLTEFKTFLEKDIYDIVSNRDSDLINIRDEMLSLINQTLYLFTLD